MKVAILVLVIPEKTTLPFLVLSDRLWGVRFFFFSTSSLTDAFPGSLTPIISFHSVFLMSPWLSCQLQEVRGWVCRSESVQAAATEHHGRGG